MNATGAQKALVGVTVELDKARGELSRILEGLGDDWPEDIEASKVAPSVGFVAHETAQTLLDALGRGACVYRYVPQTWRHGSVVFNGRGALSDLRPVADPLSPSQGKGRAPRPPLREDYGEGGFISQCDTAPGPADPLRNVPPGPGALFYEEYQTDDCSETGS